MANKIVNTFDRGLVKSDNKIKQPENSYSFALNAAPNEFIADRASRTNEKGFDDYIDLGKEYVLLGSQWLGKEQYVLFIKNINYAESEFNEIWYIDKDKNIQELKYSNLELRFKSNTTILSTYRVDYRNHRLVYFVDGVNDDRVIDIDDINVSSLNIDFLSLNIKGISPDISARVESGSGAVKSGQYFICSAYRDTKGNLSNTSLFTPPMTITTGNYFEGETITHSNSRSFINIKGVEPNTVTDKSILISVNNLDTNFDSLNLYIVQVLDTNTSIYTVENIQINGTSLEYRFTGINIQEDNTITINDLLVERVVYYGSEVINQKENRLIRGNLKTRESLINYQQIANNIIVNYGIEEELVLLGANIKDFSLPASESISTPDRQFYTIRNIAMSPEYLSGTAEIGVSSKTFMRDEVYALGISFELIDGSETDVFHIPGRTPNSIPTSYTGPNLIGEYGLAFTSGNADNWDTRIADGGEKWLTRNTAAKRSGSAPSTVPNFLGYWRSDEVYPEGFGYPTDGEQDSNNKSYIRHHKMPSDVLEPIYRFEETSSDPITFNFNLFRRNIKLIFNNIVIPEEYTDIITKIRFHFVERNDTNKSIISKGLVYNTNRENFSVRQSPQFNSFGEQGLAYIHQFISPDTDFRFKEFPVNADRFKSGYVSKGYVTYYGRRAGMNPFIPQLDNKYLVGIINNYHYDINDDNPPYIQSLHGHVSYLYNAIPNENIYSFTTEDTQFVDGNSSGVLNTSIAPENYNFTGEVNTIVFAVPLDESLVINPIDYSILSFENSGSSNLLDFNFEGYTDPSMAAELTELYYDSVIYGSLVRDDRSQYGRFPSQLNYIATGTTVTTDNRLVYDDIEELNGDSFIDIHYSKKGFSFIFPENDRVSLMIPEDGGIPQINSVKEVRSQSYISYVVETQLNVRNRTSNPSNDDIETDYWPISPLSADADKITYSYDKKSLLDEYYNIYNFNNTQGIKEYYGVTKKLEDFTDTAKYSLFQNRLIYSDKQSYEDRVDNFRITRANNYKDLPMDRGQITQSFIKDDKFFVTTRDALFNVYASNKTIQSLDSDNIVVGTGEFFALEPVELISIKGGFGGTTSKLSLNESPYGYLFVDRFKDKIILFNEGLKDINLAGLHENLNLELFKQIEELEDINEFDRPQQDVGIITSYDPKLLRLLITKKDYLALDPVLDNYKGRFNEEVEYNIGDIVEKEGELVRITDIIETFTPKWIGSDAYCVQEEGFNNGLYTFNTLVKVSDDENEYPLDINNVRTSVSGLPQDSKPNNISDSDYITPVENTAECPVTVNIIIDNEDTDTGDMFRLFVDTDVEIWLNSTLIHTVRSTEIWSAPLSVGDNLEIIQVSDLDNNPWPPSSTASLNIERNGNVLYSNSTSTQANTLNSFSFTITTPGVYSVKSLGSSTASGYRKYTTMCERVGGGSVVLLGHVFTDNTTGLKCSEKGSNIGLAEYNTVDDGGTLDIRTENQHPSLSFDVEITGTTTRNFTIGPMSNHTESNVPKGNLVITSTAI